jgi:iron complex transport system ATP-binding protein
MLEIKDLSFGYNGRNVLSGISLSVAGGEILSVAGPNGTGKSTLLKCITRIVRGGRGRVTVHDRDTTAMNRKTLAGYLGYVPQHEVMAFPVTVFETVLMGRRPHMGWMPSKKDLAVVTDVLAGLKLDRLAMEPFGRLSGGWKQKVLVARALAQEADFLILDEPTSSLDLKHQLDVLEQVRAVAVEKNVGVIMAMHDLNLTARFSDRVLMMKDGRVHGLGKPWDVINEESIRAVYQVDAVIGESHGNRFVMAGVAPGDNQPL